MMTIWKTPIDLELIKQRGLNSMVEFLGIEFYDITENSLSARMPVNERTRQPLGIMHGGSSCVLAETVGSTAANYAVDFDHFYCVGLDINTNHIRSIRDGFVFATAIPFHLGSSTQVWGINITDENAKLISVNRLTMAVLSRSK